MHSLRESASMVFDTILGRRKDDYHGDIHHEAASMREREQQSQLSDTVRHVPMPPLPRIPSLPHGNVSVWRDPERRRARFLALLNRRAWKTAMVLFACILLFGEQVRVIFLPPKADDAVDTVFCVSILFFLIDIAMRCDAEDGYCPHSFVCRGEGDRGTCGISCSCGSFLFWCDLVSTLALFYDISWIRTRVFAEVSIVIVLNEWGVPVRSCCRWGMEL
jgi:hypothetical protein